MSHERTVIEPSDGLTVLVGPNNCGKSAFVSALQILCHNAKSNYVLRHGEKKCEIIVETDDGHSVHWSRKRSGSPRYVINGQEFDRLKGGVPVELHEILGLGKVSCEKDEFDIHFGEQKSPVFLLNDSGKASAQFFASSSDAIRLVEMQDRHKTKVRDVKRDHARLVVEQQHAAEQLELLQPIDLISDRLSECEREFREIADSEVKLEQTEIMIRAFAESQVRLANEEAKSKCLRGLKPTPQIQETESLDQLTTRLVQWNRSLQHASAAQTALRQLESSPQLADAELLQGRVEHLVRVESDRRLYAQRCQTMTGLVAPPATQNESRLETLTIQIIRATHQSSRAGDWSRALSRLDAPPEPVDFSQLESLLKEMGAYHSRLMIANQETVSLEQQTLELTAKLQNWVSAHPECPMCGAKTSVDQLTTSGGHRHD